VTPRLPLSEKPGQMDCVLLQIRRGGNQVPPLLHRINFGPLIPGNSPRFSMSHQGLSALQPASQAFEHAKLTLRYLQLSFSKEKKMRPAFLLRASEEDFAFIALAIHILRRVQCLSIETICHEQLCLQPLAVSKADVLTCLKQFGFSIGNTSPTIGRYLQSISADPSEDTLETTRRHFITCSFSGQ